MFKGNIPRESLFVVTYEASYNNRSNSRLAVTAMRSSGSPAYVKSLVVLPAGVRTVTLATEQDHARLRIDVQSGADVDGGVLTLECDGRIAEKEEIRNSVSWEFDVQ